MKKTITLIFAALIAVQISAQESDKIPVGTIVSSILEPFEFMKAADSRWPIVPSNPKSKWVPADGVMDISGSKYFRITKKNHTPDLRGMFIRGLNEFQLNQKRTDGKEDPDGTGRKSGDYQMDDLKSHNHNFHWYVGSGARLPNNFPGIEKNSYNPNTNQAASAAVAYSGGQETRPRNIAVYYYIKIN